MNRIRRYIGGFFIPFFLLSLTACMADQLPKNQRGEQDRTLLVQNVVSIPFPAVPLAEVDDGSILIRSISDEIDGIQLVNRSGDIESLISTKQGHRLISDAIATKDGVIWVEAPADRTQADWRIIHFDTSTEETRVLSQGRISTKDSETATMVPTSFAPILSVSGSRMVWSTFEPAETGGSISAVVQLMDLDTGVISDLDRIDDAFSENFDHPKISGDWVVYTRGRIIPEEGKYGSVMLFDINTGEKQVLDECLDCSQANIAGPVVVWIAGRTELKLYDLERKETITLVSDQTERWGLSLNEDILTWMDSKGETEVMSLSDFSRLTIPAKAVNGSFVSERFLFWFEATETGISTSIVRMDDVSFP